MCASSSGAIMRGLQRFFRGNRRFFAGTGVLQLEDDGRFQATYDCSISEIYRLEPFD